jgi:hypothetical protein
VTETSTAKFTRDDYLLALSRAMKARVRAAAEASSALVKAWQVIEDAALTQTATIQQTEDAANDTWDAFMNAVKIADVTYTGTVNEASERYAG